MKDLKPIIQIDTREQRPLIFNGWPTETVTLSVGDYGLKHFSDWQNPQFIVERKSLGDLVSSLTHGRERFTREIEKLRQFRFRAVLIEAIPGEIEHEQYVSDVEPQAIFQSIAAFQVRTNLHFIWSGTPEGAARMFERLARQFIRGILKDAGRLERACVVPEPATIDEGMGAT